MVWQERLGGGWCRKWYISAYELLIFVFSILGSDNMKPKSTALFVFVTAIAIAVPVASLSLSEHTAVKKESCSIGGVIRPVTLRI
jgi:hypothetical protein